MNKTVWKIPKIIHQIWFGEKTRPVQWMDSWKEMHPDWTYMLWTENNLPPLKNQGVYNLVKNHLTMTQRYPAMADIARAEILYEWGGVYIDADCECVNPLDQELMSCDFFACYENEKIRPGLINNAVFGCTAKHPLIAYYRDYMSHIDPVMLTTLDPWQTIGPWLFTHVIRTFPNPENNASTILPSYKFYPLHFEGSLYTGQEKIYAKHHWLSTVLLRLEESNDLSD
jgi:mannosyltransferase OCH1-like enzyme